MDYELAVAILVALSAGQFGLAMVTNHPFTWWVSGFIFALAVSKVFGG